MEATPGACDDHGRRLRADTLLTKESPMILGHARRLAYLTTAFVLLGALLCGALVAGAASARADDLVGTSMTLTTTPISGGFRLTATLTADDGSTPVGVPLSFSFGSPGAMTSVSGAVTDANGQYGVNEGYPDYGTTYSFATSGDETYGPSTSNSVHVAAPVTTPMFELSNLAGLTVSGIVWTTPRHVRKSGLTVTLYSVGSGGALSSVASRVSDDAGGWPVSLPPVTAPVTYVADITSDDENAGSRSQPITLAIPTRTVVAATAVLGRVTLHGAVLDADGTGQPGVRVRLSSVETRSRTPHTLTAVTTKADGTFSYSGGACAVVCRYAAVVDGDAERGYSYGSSTAVAAPTRLVLATARTGHALTLTLTRAASGAALARQAVIVYYHRPGARTWTRQTSVTTGRAGSARLVEPRSRSYFFMARYAATSTLGATASKSVYLGAA